MLHSRFTVQTMQILVQNMLPLPSQYSACGHTELAIARWMFPAGCQRYAVFVILPPSHVSCSPLPLPSNLQLEIVTVAFWWFASTPKDSLPVRSLSETETLH